jgi:hypothetical protein
MSWGGWGVVRKNQRDYASGKAKVAIGSWKLFEFLMFTAAWFMLIFYCSINTATTRKFSKAPFSKDK